MRTPLTEAERARAKEIAEKILERNRTIPLRDEKPVPVSRHGLVLLARYVRDTG